jgi:23S rRNA (uracil1939-C5)-methyltransferase
VKKSKRSLSRGEKHRVKVEGIGSYGEGLARIEDAEIFIPKTAPGDEVLVEICEEKKGRYRAKILEFISLSEVRSAPRCKHFSDCGGCDFQHLPYEDQMAWKLRMTKHWIRRSPLAPGLDKIIFDTIRSPRPYEYRHRVRLQIKNHKLHFFKPHSNDLLEIEECPIMSEGFFHALQEQARTLPDTKDLTETYINGQVIAADSSFEMDGHRIGFSKDCFTQANLEVNQAIWSKIKNEVISLQSKKQALDLYCGIGNFTLPLKDHFENVTGVESELNSIQWAQKNSNDIRWIAGLSEQVLKQFETKRAYFDFVLLDPPRAGARPCIEILARMLPERIVYVSCSLDSLIPDLVHLVKKSRYEIKRWVVADMFPQTHHIESVVTLDRRL